MVKKLLQVVRPGKKALRRPSFSLMLLFLEVPELSY
jgi:hypothetical protein